MAKIVIDAREFTTTSGRYMNNLVKYLQEIDTANEYVILLQPHDAKKWQPTGKNFTVVTTKYKEFTFGEQLGFAWQLYKLKADLVHFGMIQQPLLYFKRSVSTFHDLTTVRFRNPNKPALVFWLKSPPYRLVIWWAAHKNKLILTPTEFVKKDVAKFAHIDPDKIIATLESADEFTEQAVPIKSLIGKEFIMYVGRPQPHKNLGRLIEAFAKLKTKHPNLQLVIAGKKDPVHDIHIATAQRLGVADDVVFTGFVSDGELRWMYQTCQAYIFPSLSEGFGLPGLEAMIHGAPVVCSNASCLPEVYGNGVEYFNPKNVNNMAAKIDYVISNPELRRKLIVKGHSHAKQFSWKRMAEQTLDVYDQALSMN